MNIAAARRHFPAGGRMVAAQKTQGPEVCSFRAGKVTIRLYGNKTFTSVLCKLIHKGLAGK